ncbi:conjugative transposon protein TraM [uncultured Draconibacterium sp.]|uniref:conjugative transposon protein TraM n=1 Tax=uncultured Draconibacterium sp. TaxID=1573823 RepID=UPI003217EF60
MKTYLKKNKALFFLPVVLIPFVILIFYVLGGGEDAQKAEESLRTENAEGANYILPEADKSIEIFDKLEAYQRQEMNSEVRTQSTWERDSSNVLNPNSEDSTAIELSLLAQQNQHVPDNLLAHIKQKEKELRKELDEPQQNTEIRKEVKRNTGYKSGPKVNSYNPNPIIQTTGIEELDKVFDENIELNRQNDSLKFYLEQNQKRLAEIEQKQNSSFSLHKKQASGFSGNEENSLLIKAEVYETTTVLDGNRVKLRLLEDTWVNKKKIPRNSFIYGICKIKNERLHIQITQLPVGPNFLPVNLAIHDLDGMPGLYVPDNATRKVTQEVGSSANSSSLFGVTNNPLTYAGIRAADRTAQTILKRTRLKKVTVKKNTLVYIINQKQ